MQYRWDDFTLDREGGLLTRAGEQVDVSRKVLDCISHLVEHRERVLGYDELIRQIWGHDNVTNHQLSQVVLAARRAVGDDGQKQRLIRTMPGLGYRWIGGLTQVDPETAQTRIPAPAPGSRDTGHTAHAAKAATQAPHSDVPPPAPALPPQAQALPHGRRLRDPHRWRLASLVALLVVSAAAYGLLLERGPSPIPATRLPGQALSHAGPAPISVPSLRPGSQTVPDDGAQQASEAASGAPPDDASDPIGALQNAMQAGDFEKVREGLATLPPSLANTPDARLLEIELDLQRGRTARALDKIEAQLSTPQAMADPILQARLLILKTKASQWADRSPEEVLAVAESAIRILDQAQTAVPVEIRAAALRRRAPALVENGRLDDALRDLAQASDLYESIGDRQSATDIKVKTARVWMRMGRLQEALEASASAADTFRQMSLRVDEIFARNTMSRIQMELLRWDEALATNDRSMALLREVPDAERRHRTLHLRAQILIAKGRLRLAAAQLEEAENLRNAQAGFIIPAIYHLEAGNPALAMQHATKAFEDPKPGDPHNILLDSQDGALLLWVMAAQMQAGSSAASASALPTPSPEQSQRLRKPASTLARIARGRWLWSQGQETAAEAEFRAALKAARQSNQMFRMTLAAEPLVEMLLRKGRVDAANAVIVDLRAFDRARMDGDYRVSLLRMRVASAAGDQPAVAAAYRNLRALAGERALPADVLPWPAKSMVPPLSAHRRDSVSVSVQSLPLQGIDPNQTTVPAYADRR
jgi:DNA-binding winged helix-turn-helix (wHTH) protein/tetratricopeptide (TPR) repeat protein